MVSAIFFGNFSMKITSNNQLTFTPTAVRSFCCFDRMKSCNPCNQTIGMMKPEMIWYETFSSCFDALHFDKK